MLGVSDSVFEEFIFGRFFDKKEKIVGNPISVELIRRKTDGYRIPDIERKRRLLITNHSPLITKKRV